MGFEAMRCRDYTVSLCAKKQRQPIASLPTVVPIGDTDRGALR